MDCISRVQIGCPMFTYDNFFSEVAFFNILFVITEWEVHMAEYWPKLLLKSERKD